ncbi:MAG: hypothetical protein ACLTKG_08405 [Collinsella intestinalis]
MTRTTADTYADIDAGGDFDLLLALATPLLRRRPRPADELVVRRQRLDEGPRSLERVR